MSYVLDVEQFIQEIKKYPEIWDLNCEDNRHKNKKQQAWTEVARLFIPEFDDMPEIEKDDVYRKLFGKWRNIRDSFVRHIKRPDGKKGYIYAKHLSFLKAIYNVNTGSESEENDSNSNLWEESNDDPKVKSKKRHLQILNDCNWSDEEQPSTIENLKRKRLPHVTNVQSVKSEEAIEFVGTPPPPPPLASFPETSFSVEDDDRSFFESLLPAVRAFDLDQKLEFRSQVITLVKHIRTAAQSKANHSSG